MLLRNRRVFGIFLLVSLIVLPVATTAVAQTAVAVVNQPKITVPTPIPHSHLVEFTNIPISGNSALPIPLTLEAGGFTHVMLSIAVEVQGLSPSSGTVTATLIPATPFVDHAYNDEGTTLFPLIVAAAVEENGRSIFGSPPFRYPLSHPKYNVYITNTSDRSVKAYLYAYLTQ